MKKCLLNGYSVNLIFFLFSLAKCTASIYLCIGMTPIPCIFPTQTVHGTLFINCHSPGRSRAF